MKADLQAIQRALKKEELDGWLFADIQARDTITQEFLGLKGAFATRRLFYFIPAKGQPVKILSGIEPLLLDHLPGSKRLYLGLEQQTAALGSVLKPGMRIAMQYSEQGNVPLVSTMDAGLFEFLKGFGIRPVSSGDLLQYFQAVLTEAQLVSHKEAGERIHRVLNQSFAWIRRSLDQGEKIEELGFEQVIFGLFEREGLEADGRSIFFGVDEHGADPGYEPTGQTSREIREGSRLIIDISGRLPGDDSVFYDVSWNMQVGKQVDPEYERLFQITREARDQAIELIQREASQGRKIPGCQVDRQTMDIFRKYGVESYRKHRTGHNIGHHCHGKGANLDAFETVDTRSLLPGTLFSVEPGIYTDIYGLRTEVDVYLTEEGKARVYGPVQKGILCI